MTTAHEEKNENHWVTREEMAIIEMIKFETTKNDKKFYVAHTMQITDEQKQLTGCHKILKNLKIELPIFFF